MDFTVPEIVSLDRDMINKLLDSAPFTPSRLISALKSNAFLKKLFTGDSGVFEGYSLERHTAMVLGQFERYFPGCPWPKGVCRSFFRLFLALHDIGKPEAVRHGHKSRQHEYTVLILPEVFEVLGRSPFETRLALALVRGDYIGTALRGKIDPSEAARCIREQALDSGLPLTDFFDLLTMYYLCDAGSYTEDAGGIKSLDYLFVFDRVRPAIALAPPYRETFTRIKKAVTTGEPPRPL